jgi:hypothetical protein
MTVLLTRIKIAAVYPWYRKFSTFLALSGLIVGAVIGSHVGIAALGTAIAGTWVCSAIGGLIGYLAGLLLDREQSYPEFVPV